MSDPTRLRRLRIVLIAPPSRDGWPSAPLGWIEFMPALPKTANGKIRLFKLR